MRIFKIKMNKQVPLPEESSRRKIEDTWNINGQKTSEGCHPG